MYLNVVGCFLYPISAVRARSRIDIIRADAPELAVYGEQTVGVRQIDFIHKKQIDDDVLNAVISRKDGDVFRIMIVH